MEIAFRTDVGKLREHNEDAGDYFLTDELLFAVVADGMGGHNAGDVASEMAVQSVRERWQEAPPAAEEEAIKEWLLQTVEAANRRIYAASVEHQEMSGMGTTLVCALVFGDRFITAHVGDSRCYERTEDGVLQITNDHTLVHELVKSGQITEAEAMVHPRKNVVTRALGTEEHVQVDIGAHPLEGTRELLICSDGLSDKLTTDDVEGALASPQLEESADELLQLALTRGGEDNITFILLRQEGSA
ncbi:Stp1/IreP family PP2C-type Ser/Thr phosphatase [Geomicrobium sp. JCM 19039]|uniref:Stp1/IreP family PP2C-type Ser/Thr phosphatase n=1 Tax=Geomicrobium sp. JCM 19039 TaxID=1460636 RepID=UPI00045F387A|nr:Stp1/IreP family PP2C-type Ser/Thr phosphatase [Geomicrobium sp. JCM 19039]GAK10868.1 serine/threonine phosphatase PrpC [Geomicrobium sp. JCM 19039]